MASSNKAMIITNPEGTKFGVKVITKGDNYGLDDCLTHGKADPLVEFYYLGRDAEEEKRMKRIHGEAGFFVSRYYAETLAENIDRATSLDGGNPKMWIGASNKKAAIRLAWQIQ